MRGCLSWVGAGTQTPLGREVDLSSVLLIPAELGMDLLRDRGVLLEIQGLLTEPIEVQGHKDTWQLEVGSDETRFQEKNTRASIRQPMVGQRRSKSKT